jgi:hypothetical protein
LTPQCLEEDVVDGVVRLISKAFPAVSPKEDPLAEGVAGLELASDLSVAEQAARFAGAAITGRGYEIGGLDWGKMLDRWRPADFKVGDAPGATLQPSGVLARRLTSPATVSLDEGSDATMFVVTDTGSKTTTQEVTGSSVCLVPEPGEKVYVGAVRTKKGSGAVSLVATKPTCR